MSTASHRPSVLVELTVAVADYLAGVAARLRQLTGDGDMAARLDGDELIVITTRAPLALARALAAATRQPVAIHGVRLSIGICQMVSGNAHLGLGCANPTGTAWPDQGKGQPVSTAARIERGYHLVADYLAGVASGLRQLTGDGDMVARLDGDELVVITTRAPLALAQTLAATRQPVTIDGTDVAVRLSIGVPDH
jgi:GGDEF domain-containing protein